MITAGTILSILYNIALVSLYPVNLKYLAAAVSRMQHKYRIIMYLYLLSTIIIYKIRNVKTSQLLEINKNLTTGQFVF